MDKLIEKSKETNTVLELNANPMRFDLSTEHLRQAQDAGVHIAINTDAHKTGTFYHMDYGVKMGRKAWLTNDTVINTDRKSTRLNSSHVSISYAVFCLKKKKTEHTPTDRRHSTPL